MIGLGIQLFDNRCPITAFFIGHSSINYFAVILRKNRVLTEPIRFEEIAIFIVMIILFLLSILLLLLLLYYVKSWKIVIID